MSDGMRTFQIRIPEGFEAPLNAYANLMSKVKHKLFADLCKRKAWSNMG